MLNLQGRIAWPGLELDVDIRTQSRRIALVGASGSGKSSLLRCLAGLEPQQPLDVTFDGQAWSRREGQHVESKARRVGWVPQHGELFPHLTAFENLAFGGSCRSARRVADALEIAHVLDRNPATLSGGERQRVALGRALNRDPRLLLLDEPFSALDRALRGRIKKWVVQTCDDRELPFVIVSHDRRDVSDVADEVWEITSGEVVRAALR